MKAFKPRYIVSYIDTEATGRPEIIDSYHETLHRLRHREGAYIAADRCPNWRASVIHCTEPPYHCYVYERAGGRWKRRRRYPGELEFEAARAMYEISDDERRAIETAKNAFMGE